MEKKKFRRLMRHFTLASSSQESGERFLSWRKISEKILKSFRFELKVYWKLEDEIELGILTEELLRSARKYADRTASTGVTRKTFQRTIDRLKMTFRKTEQFTFYEKTFIPGQMSPIGRVEPMLSPFYVTEKVLELKSYVREGILDTLDIYLILAKEKGFKLEWAANRIGYSPSGARSALKRAKEYLERGIQKGKGRPRKVDEDRLYAALVYVIENEPAKTWEKVPGKLNTS